MLVAFSRLAHSASAQLACPALPTRGASHRHAASLISASQLPVVRQPFAPVPFLLCLRSRARLSAARPSRCANIRAVGYTEADIAGIFARSIENW